MSRLLQVLTDGKRRSTINHNIKQPHRNIFNQPKIFPPANEKKLTPETLQHPQRFPHSRPFLQTPFLCFAPATNNNLSGHAPPKGYAFRSVLAESLNTKSSHLKRQARSWQDARQRLAWALLPTCQDQGERACLYPQLNLRFVPLQSSVTPFAVLTDSKRRLTINHSIKQPQPSAGSVLTRRSPLGSLGHSCPLVKTKTSEPASKGFPLGPRSSPLV